MVLVVVVNHHSAVSPNQYRQWLHHRILTRIFPSLFSSHFLILLLLLQLLLLLLLRLRLLNTTIQYHGQLINNCIVLWKIDVAGRCEYMPHVLILNSFPLNVRPVVVDALLLHVVIKSNWMSTQTNTNQLHLSFVTYFFGAFRSLVILIIRQARQCLREMEKKTEGYRFFFLFVLVLLWSIPARPATELLPVLTGHGHLAVTHWISLSVSCVCVCAIKDGFVPA